MEQQTQKNSAYSYLKDKLLSCEIKPGEYINEKELIASTQFGRTPIREALILLQAEDLVQVVPRQGTYATKIELKRVKDLYGLRKLLEPAVAAEYNENLDLERLIFFDHKMKEMLAKEKYDRKEFIDLDIAFHRYIASGCGNERIIGTLEPLFQETYRIAMFNALVNTENLPETTWREHHEIIAAIMGEDRAEIQRTLRIHLNSSLLSSLASFNRSHR